jgi:hypothetical protein
MGVVEDMPWRIDHGSENFRLITLDNRHTVFGGTAPQFNSNCFDIVVVNCSRFISMQNKTSDLFVLSYLRTLFQPPPPLLLTLVTRKCEKKGEQLVVLI